MKVTPDKCHLVTSYLCKQLKYNKWLIWKKILGIKIDEKLNFNTQIDEICIKSGQTLNALLRVTTYIDFSKDLMLFNAFFLSQSLGTIH